MSYRTLSTPAAPLARPALPWLRRAMHQVVRGFDLDDDVRWRRRAGGRWARFILVPSDSMDSPDDLHAAVVGRYGDDTMASWRKAMSLRWHPMLACPHRDFVPVLLMPGGSLDDLWSTCGCEVWP
ncbi:MAG: hypothetical protein Q8S73_36835 [Deltaproteobacteria bacterium]|nr:hypothetical protein [Myxococcales bacterium]MDP3219726.1 hypothetical protein [Deltaproteobacteria bacterium]